MGTVFPSLARSLLGHLVPYYYDHPIPLISEEDILLPYSHSNFHRISSRNDHFVVPYAGYREPLISYVFRFSL